MNYILAFLKRISLLLFVYLLSRLFFVINNQNLIASIENIDFSLFSLILESLRFDLSILLYINFLVFLLFLFPNNLHLHLWYRKFIRFIFYLFNIPFILLNNIDIEFFQYNQKRITSDFLDLLLLGNDTIQIMPNYIIQYWPLLALSVFQIFILTRIADYKPIKIPFSFKSFLKPIFLFLIMVGLFVVGARGGHFKSKPIKVINAGEMSNPIFSSIVLNTPFCFLHSFNNDKLKEYKYYDKNVVDTIYTTYRSRPDKELNKKNIVIIIMESLSKEFVGYYNDHDLTPFLDSLIGHSLVFNNAFSNGLRSIEALPAITASIPALANTPFITSSYAQNNFNSLASILSKEGYSTSFFHGGNRGTMGFYSFTKRAGFNKYYGLKEYDNSKDFDGTWGIYDEPFFNFFANTLNAESQPFFTTFFSLSAHSPYSIPEKYNDVFIDGDLEIHKLITYSDYSLKNFFNSIKDQEWYNNTIFVITADHTSPGSNNKIYKNKIGRYSIPMLFFTPDQSLKGQNDIITQHIDIMPSLLDRIGYSKPYIAFGESVFDKNGWALHYINNRYCLITENGLLNNIDENYINYADWSLKNKIKTNSDDIMFLKSFKQVYTQSMKDNNLKVK